MGRVKYILGDPIEEVLECFENALSKGKIAKDFVAIYQQYGLFYEILGPGYPEALQESYCYHTKLSVLMRKTKPLHVGRLYPCIVKDVWTTMYICVNQDGKS